MQKVQNITLNIIQAYSNKQTTVLPVPVPFAFVLRQEYGLNASVQKLLTKKLNLNTYAETLVICIPRCWSNGKNF